MSELSPLSLKIWCKGWDEREMRAIEAANIVRCEFCVLINTRHHRYVEEKGRKERSDVMHALSKIIYPGHPKKKKERENTTSHGYIAALAGKERRSYRTSKGGEHQGLRRYAKKYCYLPRPTTSLWSRLPYKTSHTLHRLPLPA